MVLRRALVLACMLALGGCYPMAASAPSDPGLSAVTRSLSASEIDRRNGQARAMLYQVALALEQYALDHEDRYPPTESWVAALTEGEKPYLPDGQLPLGPWTVSRHQANPLPLAALEPRLQGAQPTAGTVLGPANEPESHTYTPQTLGALLYKALPELGTYQLVVVGQQGEQAIVAGAFNVPPKRP